MKTAKILTASVDMQIGSDCKPTTQLETAYDEFGFDISGYQDPIYLFEQRICDEEGYCKQDSFSHLTKLETNINATSSKST